jgi:hypothetical protein
LLSQVIVSQMDIVAQPQPIVNVIVKTSIALGWFLSASEARENAERWKPRVLQRLRDELDQFNRVGRFCPFTFNSSSADYLQGSAFIEPKDSNDVKEVKQRRVHFSAYVRCLQELSPREFEALCTGLLQKLGATSTVLTKSTGDEGIDFYGKLPISSNFLSASAFPGIHTQMAIWMIGQAKHYIKGQVSTPDIRELVGSVVLARSRAFSMTKDQYQDLAIRACDPVFFLFFTTGRISSYGWKLLASSGVVGMDGEMVAVFLADCNVGVQDTGDFDDKIFWKWVRKFL